MSDLNGMIKRKQVSGIAKLNKKKKGREADLNCKE